MLDFFLCWIVLLVFDAKKNDVSFHFFKVHEFFFLEAHAGLARVAFTDSEIAHGTTLRQRPLLNPGFSCFSASFWFFT
jgi:hypothetical protein